MNKFHIFGLIVAAAAGFTACSTDDTPRIQRPTELVLDAPAQIDQKIELARDGMMEYTCSRPDYGLPLATEFCVEVSIYSDFGASLQTPPTDADGNKLPLSVDVLPDNPFTNEMEIHQIDIAKAIADMRGWTKEEQLDFTPMPLYLRAKASVNKQEVTTIVSQIIKLSEVVVCNPFSPKILYTPGGANGWKQEASLMLQYNSKDKNYWGFAYLKDEFKLTSQKDWSGTNYGIGDAEGKLSTSGGNIPVANAGFYWLIVDVEKLTYKMTPVTTLGMIGDFNEWGGDVNLTPDKNYSKWTGTLKITAAGGFKFRANNSWDINLGGSFEDLVLNGGNLSVEPGEYTVTLDLSKAPYTCTLE